MVTLLNNHLLVFHRSEEGEDSSKVPLLQVCFWAQIHENPLGFFTEGLAKQLEDFVGRFMVYDSESIAEGLQAI